MRAYKRNHWIILHLSGYLSLVMLFAIGLPSDGVFSKSGSNLAPSETPLKVELKVNARRFRSRDPIIITVQIENISANSIYIAQELGFLDKPEHGYRLEIFTRKGEPVRYWKGFTDTQYGEEIFEDLIRKHYLLLHPHSFYGRRHELKRDWYNLRRPGKYKLRVVFYEREAAKWDPDEREGIYHEVWTGELPSNEVEIEILP